MTVYTDSFNVETAAHRVSFIDITPSVKQAIQQSDITTGSCLIVTAHTTCAILFEEFTHDTDENNTDWLLLDLNDALEKIIPPHTAKNLYRYPGEAHYQEVESWPNLDDWLPNGDRTLLWNGDAHLKASLLGASETFAVIDGQLATGKTGYLYFVDFDQTRERTRQYRIVIIGE